MSFSTVWFLKRPLFKMHMLDSLTFEVLSIRGYDFLGFHYVYTPIKLFTREGHKLIVNVGNINPIFPLIPFNITLP